MAMDFVKQSDAGDAMEFRDDFGKSWRTIGEYLHTDALGIQFGKSDVYDNAKLNFGQRRTDSMIER